MIRKSLSFSIRINREETGPYPRRSILVALILLYLAPFLSTWLAAISFAICLYRVVKYDAKVFAVDYCLLAPISSLTHVAGSPSLLIYLSLLAGVWHIVRRGIRADAAFVLLIALLNYLLTRMQMDINSFVLCFGQMFVLYALLPNQDGESAARAIKAFCVSLTISSIYAWLLRNTPQIRALTGAESLAIWGSDILRFKGLFRDPNYYMTLLAVGLTALIKLKESNRIRWSAFLIMGGLLALFGILSYSKMFFLSLVLILALFLIWQFWNGKMIRGVALTLISLVLLMVVLSLEDSPLSVVLERFKSAKSISDLTTSRTDVFLVYIRAISGSVRTMLFGFGLAAEGLYRDPHNIYIEATYYTGFIGFSLIVAFYCALIYRLIRKTKSGLKQNIFSKYAVLVMTLVLYCALHGMFAVTFYCEMFVALLSILVTKPKTNIET